LGAVEVPVTKPLTVWKFKLEFVVPASNQDEAIVAFNDVIDSILATGGFDAESADITDLGVPPSEGLLDQFSAWDRDKGDCTRDDEDDEPGDEDPVVKVDG
jgi:hypothetical protein